MPLLNNGITAPYRPSGIKHRHGIPDNVMYLWHCLSWLICSFSPKPPQAPAPRSLWRKFCRCRRKGATGTGGNQRTRCPTPPPSSPPHPPRLRAPPRRVSKPIIRFPCLPSLPPGPYFIKSWASNAIWWKILWITSLSIMSWTVSFYTFKTFWLRLRWKKQTFFIPCRIKCQHAHIYSIWLLCTLHSECKGQSLTRTKNHMDDANFPPSLVLSLTSDLFAWIPGVGTFPWLHTPAHAAPCQITAAQWPRQKRLIKQHLHF